MDEPLSGKIIAIVSVRVGLALLLVALIAWLRSDMAKVEDRLREDMKQGESRLREDIGKLESRLDERILIG